MLYDEMHYFIENQNALVEQYNGKVLVIKGHKVIGAYKDALEAYFEAQKEHELGTFIIQPCLPGPDAYTVNISSHDLFLDAA
jgi:hypothetical protein